jgi:hypothetical protein
MNRMNLAIGAHTHPITSTRRSLTTHLRGGFVLSSCCLDLLLALLPSPLVVATLHFNF